MRGKLDRARDEVEAGGLERAHDLYLEVLRAEPGNRDALLECAALLRRLGRAVEAGELLEQGIGVQPGDATLYATLGEIMAGLGRLNGAIAACREAIKIDPGHVPALLNLAIALHGSSAAEEASERIDEAIALYRRVAELDPGNRSALANLGIACHAGERYEDAADACAEALDLYPGDLSLQNTLGSALLNLARIDEATTVYEAAVADHPASGELHFNLATAYYRQRRFLEAISAFERSAELVPGDVGVHLELGKICNSIGRYEQAAEAFRRAVNLDPASAPAHRGLGLALVGLERVDEARAAYMRALEIEPGNVATEFALKTLSGEKIAAAPEAYVVETFDRMADSFDEELLDYLEYKTPQLLRRAVGGIVSGEAADWTILDLGCGTGLCGPLFRDLAAHLTGTDLSPAMIDKARQRGGYDVLRVEPLEKTLGEASAEIDLVIAADVFVYIGDLDGVFAACARALREGGYFAFSTEHAEDGDYGLNKAMRFVHSRAYVEQLAHGNGFEIRLAETAVIRKELDEPVTGGIYLLRRSAAAAS